MAAPQMTRDDVGAYFTRDDGSVWRLVCYADEPTATLERLYSSSETPSYASILSEDVRVVAEALRDHVPTERYYGERGAAVALERIRSVLADLRDPPARVGGVVGAPIFDDFERLERLEQAKAETR